ncbi:copper resistance protein B [Sphingomonas lutea]|uniref:Copper resistance protein B n=1 Tax=Sphingomonas lutea TaxID=1045317 RepID=A0A7G9SEZ8_9SPHN|nr:copper resistance protein B [Sphingomonas lutea]QNN66423.1 copper resistance protein B [Sphingomonas lutea]
MRILVALLLAGAASPALAQSPAPSGAAPAASPATCTPEHAAMGHCKMPAPVATPPAQSCTAEHAAMGHCKMPAPAAASPTVAPQSTCTAEHAAMGHCKLPAPAPPPAAPAPQPSTCTPEHAAMGHCTLPAQPGSGDPHAGHNMGQAAAGPEIPILPPPPAASSGPAHAADTVFGDAMARSRNILREEHGGMAASKLLVDRAETRIRNGRDGYLLDAQAWYGGDIDKLWLKSEVEGDWRAKPEHIEVQALWSHAIDPWFDLQAGVRFDPQPGPNRTHLALGVQGLAPYWWEVEGTAFLSTKGELTARAEAEYDLRITQKLILQPRAEIHLSAQDIPELGIGAGVSDAEVGLRLRYQLSPLFAPYVGVKYERAFGDTRVFRRAEGERTDGFSLLAGVRFWF